MRRYLKLALVGLAVLAVGAATAATAVVAEDAGSPSLLSLTGEITKLEGKFKFGQSQFSILEVAKKVVESPKGKATIAGCTEFEKSASDTRLCTNGLITFEEFKLKGSIACRSENTAGEKDPVSTVLVKTGVHIASEITKAGVLQPEIIFTETGVDGKDLILNCGAVKVLALGNISCLLLPGLEEIAAEAESFKMACETDLNAEKEPNGDQLTGTCLQLCELLSTPFEMTFLKEGEKEKMAGFLVTATGKFNKDVLIDD
jgi:hypothetical protein